MSYRDMEASQTPLADYLRRMVEAGASDLFLQHGSRPCFRVDGRITRLEMPAPSEEEMRGYLDEVLTPVARRRFDESPDIDLAYTSGELGRFRLNLFRHQGRLGLIARKIPPAEMSFDQLHLPEVLREMAETPGGIVLVVGPTGCGKSTTLAAMVHHINSTRADHIVTIEDPIEFVHDERQSLIHQRQVGYDTESFATALRHVVRQSPDVIMIGEMRDADTVQTALSAALTGHLILSTLHTTNVVQSVDRMLNYFQPEARRQAQADLAATLVGVVSMRLLPRADGSGRVPAVEVLRGTPTVRRIIGEGNYDELYDVMKQATDTGMRTMNQSLVELCKAGLVNGAVAERTSPNRDEFRLNLAGMYTGIDSIGMRTEPDDEEDEREDMQWPTSKS